MCLLLGAMEYKGIPVASRIHVSAGMRQVRDPSSGTSRRLTASWPTTPTVPSLPLLLTGRSEKFVICRPGRYLASLEPVSRELSMIRIFRGPRHPGGWYEGAPTIVKVVAVQPHSSSGNGIAKFLERKNRPETKPPHNLQARSGERTAVGRFFLQDRQSLVPVVISLSNARSPTTNPLMSLVRGSLTKGSKSASIFRLRLARPGTRGDAGIAGRHRTI